MKDIEKLLYEMNEEEIGMLLNGVDEEISEKQLRRLRKRISAKTGIALSEKKPARMIRLRVALPIAAALLMVAVALTALILPSLHREESPYTADGTQLTETGDLREVEIDGMIFELKGDKNAYMLKKITEIQGEVIDLPAQINGIPVTEIAEGALENSDVSEFKISKNCNSFNAKDFNNVNSMNSTNITVNISTANSYFANEGSCVIAVDRNALIYNSVDSIPPSVSIIGAYAFYRRSTLTEIEVPACVVSIEDHAFAECVNLRRVILPQEISFISPDAFEGCEALEEILYNGTPEEWSALVARGGKNNPLTRLHVVFQNEEEK